MRAMSVPLSLRAPLIGPLFILLFFASQITNSPIVVDEEKNEEESSKDDKLGPVLHEFFSSLFFCFIASCDILLTLLALCGILIYHVFLELIALRG